jgi:DNA-binding MarR family transcriptional regulator
MDDLGAISITDYRALAHFRFLIRRFLALSEEMAQAKGLTPQQHQLLLAIEGRPSDREPTIGYVAERLMIKHHSAVGLVDRLEAQGLVEREHCSDDRRQVLVRLTAKGTSILRDLAASHRQELRSLAPHLVDALSAIIDSKAPDSKSSLKSSLEE